MASHDEPMDTSDGTEADTQPGSVPTEGKDEIRLTLSMSWSEDVTIQKKKKFLAKRLQTWLHGIDKTADCSVVDLPNEDNAVIMVTPPPGLAQLQELVGLTLTSKSGKKEADVTIVSVGLESVTPRASQTETKQHKTKQPESEQPEPKPEQPKPELEQPKPEQPEQPESEACAIVSDLMYWCVQHMYQEELNQILEANDVEMTSELHVFFKAKQKNGNPNKAQEEYANLVGKCSAECLQGNGKNVPLKYVDLDQWKKALTIIKQKEKKLFFTAAAGGIRVFGPEESQRVFSQHSLTSTQVANTTSSLGYLCMNEEAPPTIKMTIKDHLLEDGLTLDEGSWKQVTSSSANQVDSIKSKFNVDFKTSLSDLGIVTVRACYNRAGGNASMESHAIRALLRLHQKIATSPPRISPHALPDSSSDSKLSQASGGTTLVKESAESVHNNDVPSAGSEDNCPICFCTFTDKTTLECKHDFCKECLERSKESMGPICPVCRNVFGLVKGNQPDGTMGYTKSPHSLPGYPDCGRITIDYFIPSGRQTEKHPNPGQWFTGLNRSAYLPDNKEGNEVLHLLERAFAQKLIFTVGTSRTTGCENQVTWNDIHHKTSTHGGQQGFGYPDPDYLTRVKEELKTKGIM